MKVKTNQGDVELTAEMVVRAACERFGVHGDAAAHGFARLRDGGAVDLRRTALPMGALIERYYTSGDEDTTPDRHTMCGVPRPALRENERFIGLDARHASPEDVRRLCCGAEETTTVTVRGFAGVSPTGRVCTLAIGDHAEHEDLATGVKWSAGAERYLSNAKPREDFNASLRAAAAGVTVTSGLGNGFIFDGSAKGLSGAAKGSGGHRVNGASMVVGTPIYVTSDGRGTLNAAEAAPGCSVPVGTVVSGNMLRIDDGGTYVRGNENYRAAVDPARRGTETTVAVSATMRGDSLAAVVEAAKRAAESVRGTYSDYFGWGEPSFGASALDIMARQDESGVFGFCAFIAGLKRWAESAASRGCAKCPAGTNNHPGEMHPPSGGWRTAEQIDREVSERGRRNREAPLVALVAAVPEGLDPIGWRAAVLAVCEKMTPQDWQDDRTGEWLQRCALGKESPDGRHPASLKVVAWTAYHRAIAPAAKVERQRLTWKTRGPVLAVDRGDE